MRCKYARRSTARLDVRCGVLVAMVRERSDLVSSVGRCLRVNQRPSVQSMVCRTREILVRFDRTLVCSFISHDRIHRRITSWHSSLLRRGRARVQSSYCNLFDKKKSRLSVRKKKRVMQSNRANANRSIDCTSRHN